MVGRTKKGGPPKERGLPSQKVVPSRRRRESPRRSASSVQEDSDDRFLPTSPQAGNKGDLGNIHVSPNHQSLELSCQPSSKLSDFPKSTMACSLLTSLLASP